MNAILLDWWFLSWFMQRSPLLINVCTPCISIRYAGWQWTLSQMETFL